MIMRRRVLYLLLILVSIGGFHESAGQVCMSNTTIFTCNNFFQDDNGGSCAGDAFPYGNNDYTMTICPDNPGDVIQIDFVAFLLQTSPNPNNSDQLYIYDGPDTSAPSLGSYAGNALQGLAVTATINNPSGCLTFVFVCNTGNTQQLPGWEGLISCTTPCAPPTSSSFIADPVPTGVTQTVGVCIDAPVTFDGTGSSPFAGFTISEYIWNFGDGTIDNTSGPIVTHSYSEPGEKLVTLTVVDNNGCNSLNLEPLQVLVSTIPVFNTDFDQTVCLGGQAVLNGNPVQSITWTSLPPQVVAGTTYLADGAGFSYSSSLTFDFFDPGQTLTTCDDLLSVFMNMEHSYLGDLFMQITCPNGTSVTLLQWPNGGGGTFLGEAVDDGSVVEGIGYDYAWAPGQTNGNVDSPANWTMTSFTNQQGQNWNANIVNPGTYQATGNLCNLVGCPLNGSWTLTIVDNLAIDNGYVFSWGIDFNPFLFPGVTTFQPIIGMGPDSTYWQGPHITTVSADGNTIGVTPPALGDYDYTFFATNNFGCTFDTTITITVVPGPLVLAGPDQLICNDPLQMNPTVTVGGNPSDCNLTLNLIDSFGDGWNGCALNILIDGVQTYNFTLPFGASGTQNFVVPGGASWQAVFVAGAFLNEVSFNIVDETGNTIVNQAPGTTVGGQVVFDGVCGGFGDYVYEWSPATGLSDPNIPNPTVMLSETTTYTITVYPDGYLGCASSDEVVVFFDPQGDPGQSTTQEICFNYGTFNLFDMLDGNPVNTGTWTDQGGNVILSSMDSYTASSGVYTYTVIHNGCVAFATVTLTVLPPAIGPCCPFEYAFNATDPLCFGYTDGTAEFVITSSADGPDWTVTLFDAANVVIGDDVISGSPTLFSDLSAGTYLLTAVDAGGCPMEIGFTLVQPPVITFEASNDTTICFTGGATLQAWSDEDPMNQWTYTWDNGVGVGSSIYVNPLVETTYEVMATNMDGCLSAPLSVIVSLYPDLVNSVLPDSLICTLTEALIANTLSDGGIGEPYAYSWTANGSFIGSDPSMVVAPAATTEYCLTLTDGCETPPATSCMIVNVEVPPVLAIAADTTAGCMPLNLEFTHLIDTALVENIYWSMGNGVNYTYQTFEHTYYEQGVYDISLEVESPLGCVYNGEFPQFITVHPNPVAFYHAAPQPTYIPDTEITFTDYSEGQVVSWEWVFNVPDPLGTSVLQDPVFEFPHDVEGVYPILLTVTDINNCVDTMLSVVQINEFFNVFVPNAFSPNGDGINDEFFVVGKDIDPSRFQLKIYNRWGELVFETDDMGKPWLGNHESGDYYVPDGAYDYVIEAWSKTTSDRKIVRGFITILR